MRKDKGKGKGKSKSTKKGMKRKHLLGIAKLAKLSISTLTKWNDGSLPVKPETELKIFKATERFHEQEVVRLKEYLQSLADIEERIAARKSAVKLAIQAIQNTEVKKKTD